MVTEKQVPKQFQPYIWKKGQSGNPNGRPKGKTLKEFAREYLLSLSDDEKVEYLASLPTEIVWKMVDGNPDNKTDLTSKGEKLTGTVILPSKDVDSLETEPETNNSPQE